MIIQRKRDLNDAICAAVALHIGFMCCKNMLVSSTFINTYNAALNVIAILMVLLLYGRFLFMYAGFKRIPILSIAIISLIFVFFFISMLNDSRLFFDSTWPYSYVNKSLRLFIAYGLPLFFATSMISDFSALLSKLYKLSNFLFVVAIVCFVIGSTSWGGPKGSDDIYSMSYGNNLLMVFSIFSLKYIDENKRIDLLKMLVITALIFIDGSRGPLVSIVCLFVFLLFKRKTSQSGIFINVGISLGLFGVVIFIDKIVASLSSLFDKMGIQSRTMILLMKGELFSHDSGRSWYHETLIDAIQNSPIWGLGAFGGEKTVSMAHSFYLDVFANFGFVFGGLFLVVVLVAIARKLINNSNTSISKLLVVYSLLLFPRGFFDGGLWMWEYIWIILGILLNNYCGQSLTKKETSIQI